MATTYTLISSNTLSSSAASVTFSSIPSTYTDLVLKVSARSTRPNTLDVFDIEFNADASALYSTTILYGSGTTAASGRNSATTKITSAVIDGASATASTFANVEIYIPSYTVSQSKPVNYFGVAELNSATGNEIDNMASLYRSNTAISQIKFTCNASYAFDTGSSFYLYGIKNS